MALQVGNKFVYSLAVRNVHSSVVREALHLLTLAGLITPVKHTDGTGIPLGAEENNSYVKYLFFDLGVMLYVSLHHKTEKDASFTHKQTENKYAITLKK